MRKKWSEEMDAVLIERYANETTKALSDDTGWCCSTLEKKAHKLGLRKSKEHTHRIRSMQQGRPVLQVAIERIELQNVQWLNPAIPDGEVVTVHRLEV